MGTTKVVIVTVIITLVVVALIGRSYAAGLQYSRTGPETLEQ